MLLMMVYLIYLEILYITTLILFHVKYKCQHCMIGMLFLGDFQGEADEPKSAQLCQTRYPVHDVLQAYHFKDEMPSSLTSDPACVCVCV